MQHTTPHCNTLQRHATHSATLFGYKGPVHVSFNKVTPISAPKKTEKCRMRADVREREREREMRADVSIGTAEDECLVVLCHCFLCVFTCAQVCVVNKNMRWDVYMDEACDTNELMSQTDR